MELSLISGHLSLSRRITLAPLSEQGESRLPILSIPEYRLNPGDIPPSQVTVGTSKADGLFPSRDRDLAYQQVGRPWEQVITACPLPLDSVWQRHQEFLTTNQPRGHVIEELFTVENIEDDILCFFF